jgi:hypothetical protein
VHLVQNKKRGDLAFSIYGKKNLSPQDKKIKKLQKELTGTQIDRGILKKALTIFTIQQ